MPDEEQKQPSQRPTEVEHTPIQRDNGIREDTARDGEVLKASGARPSPNPDPDPSAPEAPVNKAVEVAEATGHETPIVGDKLSEAQTEAAPPSPSPTTDSDEGGA